MTKKGFVSLGTLAIALTSSLCLSSCGGNKAEQKSTPTTPVEVQATGLPIALVNMDSVTSQYKFAQEIKEALEKDAAAHQTRLQGKSAAIQKAAADFERRMRINAFVSAEAQQAEQQKLIRMQQEGQALSAELSEKLALKQQSLLEDMMKSIREQLKHIKRESLNRALVDTYAAKLARQHNITVSEQDIDTVIEQQRNTANGKISQETYDASSRMMYNWSPSDYRQAVRRSIVRARVAFAVDKTADELQRKAAGLVASSNGEFAKIATQLGGSGRSKPPVGDSGFINLASSYNGLAVSEIAKLEPGKPSGAIKSTTDSGYYFVKVNEKNDSKIRFTYLYIPLTELTKQVAQLKSDGKVQEYIDVPQK